MLDHLVYATPDLAVTVAELDARGIATVPGGVHVGLGTRNHLAALGDGAYLEVVGPDPDQPSPAVARPFGVDELGAAQLVAWCARPDRRLDDVVESARAVGYDPGEISSMSRRRPDGVLLSWRLTRPLRIPSTLPFLIDWLDSVHPTVALPDGIALASFTLQVPEHERTLAVLEAIGEAASVTDVTIGERRLSASVRLADGTTIDL